MALLIPPYVTEVTSDAAAAGAVMAVISLAAVLGPVLGTFLAGAVTLWLVLRIESRRRESDETT